MPGVDLSMGGGGGVGGGGTPLLCIFEQGHAQPSLERNFSFCLGGPPSIRIFWLCPCMPIKTFPPWRKGEHFQEEILDWVNHMGVYFSKGHCVLKHLPNYT